MCVSQRQWTRCSPSPPLILLLLPLSLLYSSSSPPLAQGAIQIPEGYKVQNMSQPPVLTGTPTSATVFSPEDLNITCEATGNPTPTFRWVKDEQEFGPTRTGSGSLTADPDEPLESYQGSFRCYASNTLGTAMTQTVHIIVEPQPVLHKQQKVSKSAHEGDSLILTCDPPKSSTPPHIHWMDNRMVHITQSTRVMVGIDGKLYFSNVVKSDSRDDYVCHAQYSAARTILPESEIRLTVLPSNHVAHGREPRFLYPTDSHTTVLALQGQNVFLDCIPTGLPTPTVKWTKKNGNQVDMTENLELYGRRLHFHSVSQEDDGDYECKAVNTHGHAEHVFSLTVEAAPYWVKQPPALLYSPGETVMLDCQAQGIPDPTITWSINGQPLSEVDDDPRRSITDNVLRLVDIEFTDTAVYQCEATNKHGSIILNTYLYVVELPPQILSSDGVVYRVTEGGNIELHCESFGSPRPHVTWEREDAGPLLSDPRISQFTNGTLQLSDVSHDDRDVFTCSVQHSNISITAHLEVYNRTVILKKPQDLRVLRGSNAVLDCDFYRDPGLKHYQIIWRKDGHKLHESSPDDKFTIFENGTLKVTDVQSDDTAPYSCEVITDLDHVKEAGSITVVARPDPPSDLSLSDVAGHSLTLSWTPGNAHNSPVTEFIVQSREEQHSEEGDWRWEEWKRVPGDVNSLQLTLHPYCTYSFRVIAANELGHSEPSRPSQSHETPPAAPGSNPTGVRSDSTDPGFLIITWDEMHKRLHHGQGFQYKVSWREAGGHTAPWSHSNVRSPPFVVNGTGTYTPFEIKVQAINSVGDAPEPEPEIGHSGEDAPEEPPGGVDVEVTNSTARVTWNEAQRVRGLLLGYKIHVWKVGPALTRTRRSLVKKHQEEERRREGGAERGKQKDEWRKEVLVHGMKTSAEVTGLPLFSLYELTVTAFNRKGDGPPSPEYSFSTPPGVPGPPASLWFESPSEKSLVVHWEPPAETNGILLGYMVQYQEESRDSSVRMQTIDDHSTTHMLFDALDPTLHYIFNVIARTAAGDGPPITRRVATLLDGVPPTNITVIPGNTFLNLSWVPGERDRNYGFLIHYLHKSAGDKWEESEVVNSTQGFYSLTGLQPGSEYRLKIMHGNNTQWEDVTWTGGPVPSEVAGGFATQGWLIGLISAVVLLVLILLVLCLIKRSKGGKYAVKDKEDKEVDSEARPMKDETFGEYRSLESDADEKRSDSQPSMCEDSKLGSEDSLAEYGDSVDIQFNEDGSFIGQYSGRGPVPHGNESSGPASPVNAVPPPPIAPSMSSILNRPS